MKLKTKNYSDKKKEQASLLFFLLNKMKILQNSSI